MAASVLMADDDRLVVEGDGWADVAWNGIKAITHREARRMAGLEDEMFLAVIEGIGIFKAQKMRARVGIFRRDGFVAEIEANQVRARFADNPSQKKSGRDEGQVGEFCSVAPIPKNISSRAAFD